MELTTFDENIALAKEDNARWLGYANDLVLDVDVDKECLPTYSDRCPAYRWLYEHSEEINKIYSLFESSEVDFVEFDIMEQVEILRYELRELYLQIFKRYFPRFNNSFFSHLFHLKKEMSEEQQSEAGSLLKEMESVVGELNMLLDALELSCKQMCDLNTA